MKTKNFTQGLGIIEIMVVVAVVLFGFTAILQLFRLNIQSSTTSREDLQAHALLAEAMEAARSVRDAGWINLSSLVAGADYYPVISGGAWALQTANPGPVNGFSRRIVLNQARRDTGANIAQTGGVVDPDTFQVTAYVEWTSRGRAKTKNLTTYLTNWQNKL